MTPLHLRITESQNHRIVGVGRDLCGSPSPTPLPKQGHPQQAAQDLVQAGLEYLQRRRLHNLPGLAHRQPNPSSRAPTSHAPRTRRGTEIHVTAGERSVVCPRTPLLWRGPVRAVQPWNPQQSEGTQAPCRRKSRVLSPARRRAHGWAPTVEDLHPNPASKPSNLLACCRQAATPNSSRSGLWGSLPARH